MMPTVRDGAVGKTAAKLSPNQENANENTNAVTTPPPSAPLQRWRHRYDGARLMEMVGALDGTATLAHSRTDNTWRLSDPEDPTRTPEEVAATVDLQRYVAAIQDYLQAGPLVLRRPY